MTAEQGSFNRGQPGPRRETIVDVRLGPGNRVLGPDGRSLDGIRGKHRGPVPGTGKSSRRNPNQGNGNQGRR